MILYCAADRNYFDIYFDLWEKQTSKIYPELRRHIALYNPTLEQKEKCIENNIDFNDITERVEAHSFIHFTSGQNNLHGSLLNPQFSVSHSIHELTK